MTSKVGWNVMPVATVTPQSYIYNTDHYEIGLVRTLKLDRWVQLCVTCHHSTSELEFMSGATGLAGLNHGEASGTGSNVSPFLQRVQDKLNWSYLEHNLSIP